ncbi:putative hGE-14 protein [Anaplasma phagocytophilum str. ApMUC09]|uniref:Putative hGE-14 protein n=1 Tax=Anaplasma phagocytophilum str. ApMUC09 TaxID=1359152 RepID=A0A0F3N7Y7_ANAPH|nr:putative hGE-14 protein [Anaplasma phagocytophilum str. ApMUC09]
MHTPRIFITPAMSGYAYKGISSAEYKDSLCRAITSGFMPYDECLKVIRECVIELRNTFGALQDVDAVFAAADKINSIESCITAAEGASSVEPAVQAGVLYRLIHRLYDALQDCTTAPCNKEVPCFMDVSFIRRSAHLQIAKACGILVNSVVIVNRLATTVSKTSYKVLYERDADSVFHAGLTLSAYVNVQFSALSRCLNYSPGPEETKRRKAILRVVRHNIELCNKVAELVDPEIPYCFRDRTASCLNSMLDAVGSTSAECEEMVCNNESVQRRLAIARKALLGVQCHFKVYRKLAASHDFQRFKKGEYTCALVHMMGSLFSMYRGYAAAGNAEHIVASKIERCIKILFTLYRYNARRSGDLQCKAREVYADMLCVYAEINEHIRPDLLLNPQAEIRWREAALQYCTEMMDIWKALHGRHLDVFEQSEGSPSQPSTSGLGSAAGAGEPQATSSLRAIEGTSSSPSQPSTSGLGSTAEGLGDQLTFYIPPQDHSYAQPSTSAEASSELQEAQVFSHRSQTPSDDELEPPSKRSRSA